MPLPVTSSAWPPLERALLHRVASGQFRGLQSARCGGSSGRVPFQQRLADTGKLAFRGSWTPPLRPFFRAAWKIISDAGSSSERELAVCGTARTGPCGACVVRRGVIA